MKIIKTLILLILVGVVKSSSAQVLPAQEVKINLFQAIEAEIPDAILDTLTDSFYLLQTDSTLKIELGMVLQDTTNISMINITLGNTQGGNELFQQSFSFDNYNPGVGLSYDRDGNYLTIGLGIFPNLNSAFYSVSIELEDASGNKSTIITANTN
jgi:hypothetical protein